MLNEFLRNKKLIFIYSFIFFSVGSFYLSFFPPDEPKYVDAALKMVETGNYIIPFFNCHVRFDKPILFYWEIAAFFKIFSIDSLIKSGHDPLGIIEYSARLPSIITASLTAVYIYLLSLELFRDEKSAKYSIIGYISTLFFFYLPRAVYPDMSLILFELMGVYYFIKNKYILGWTFTALAFLVKGPIGVVSVGFTYFLYLWVVKKKTGLKEFLSYNNLVGFITFVVISMPWYLAIYHKYGTEFINKFFIYNNVERFTGKAHQHPHSLFYFFPIAIAAVYLWWPFLPDLLRKTNLKDRRITFLLLWFLWVFIFFSISYNKLAHYIALGFIPLSIIFGLHINNIKNSRFKSIAMFTLETVLAIGISYYLLKRSFDIFVPTVFFGLLFMAILNFIKEPVKVVFYKIVTLSLVISAFLFQFESIRPEKKIWKEELKTHLPLIEYKTLNQSLVAYTRECIYETKNPELLEMKRGKFLVYTKIKYLKELPLKYKILFKCIDRGKKTALIMVYNGRNYTKS